MEWMCNPAWDASIVIGTWAEGALRYGLRADSEGPAHIKVRKPAERIRPGMTLTVVAD
jgi:hypothetical protein